MQATVYLAERVWTLDAARPRAQALAVRDGRLLAVGTREEAGAAEGPTARRVDLGAATVVPGLVDAHAPGRPSTTPVAAGWPRGWTPTSWPCRKIRWRGPPRRW